MNDYEFGNHQILSSYFYLTQRVAESSSTTSEDLRAFCCHLQLPNPNKFWRLRLHYLLPKKFSFDRSRQLDSKFFKSDSISL
ncbi:hypothetical protein AAHA92_01135 [Salvia divinorum]|uniref:Uncharacterized protein n=1 Tax=Salvia divinorum TaxID=28513 RepID=A0ABD1IP79_SALDI